MRGFTCDLRTNCGKGRSKIDENGLTPCATRSRSTMLVRSSIRVEPNSRFENSSAGGTVRKQLKRRKHGVSAVTLRALRGPLAGEQVLHRRRFKGISPIGSAIRLRAQVRRATRRVRVFRRDGSGAIRDPRHGDRRTAGAYSVVRARERPGPWSRQRVSGRSEPAAAPKQRWLANRTRQSEAAAEGSLARRTTRSVRRAIPT